MRMLSPCIALSFPRPFLLSRLTRNLLPISMLFCPFFDRHVAVAWLAIHTREKAPIA